MCAKDGDRLSFYNVPRKLYDYAHFGNSHLDKCPPGQYSSPRAHNKHAGSSKYQEKKGGGV